MKRSQTSEAAIAEALAGAIRIEPMDPTPIRTQLGARSKRFFDAFENARSIEPKLDVDYLIKGWLLRGQISVLFGKPNVGKTFLGLSIADAVSKGADWCGCRTRKAPALYILAEGGETISNRIAALDDPGFFLLRAPVDLRNKSLDATFIGEAVRELQKAEGPIGLIVIDTLARAITGADESSGVDMGRFVQAVEHLRDMTGAHIMIVHHEGKDAAMGARGHSSLVAAIDTEINLTKEKGSDVIEALATKQRDMAAGGMTAYRLRQVELGVDQDGDPVTTCVAEHDAIGASPSRAKVKGKAEVALQALQQAIEEHGEKRAGPDYPCNRKVVSQELWRAACQAKGLFSETKTDESARKAFNRVRETLQEKDLARSQNGLWWLV